MADTTAPIKIYGLAGTRANRNIWMARELGVPFKLEELAPLETIPGDTFGHNKFPLFVDSDGTTMFESLAINLYLCRKYGASCDVAPQNLQEEAAVLQWSVWAMYELDFRLFELVLYNSRVMEFHPIGPPEAYERYFGRPRSEDRAHRLFQELCKYIGMLEIALTGTEWLAASRFTVADLNVSIVLSWSSAAPEFVGSLLNGFPNVEAWLRRCLSRPHSPMSNPYPSRMRPGEKWVVDKEVVAKRFPRGPISKL
eukprot:gnl/TRDRNA2_/TRDRNA2_60076_c0_seq1.p1 gnl/TRDRNA2_/TRDRNA2_60076_c0~~gnl/TRDRNA2_/TRDRNA2_60076_c0_seq1.p1  ORF type:complete len:254 (+),score=23.79 gnl/TRDRNA2_/TRDRNA2_60076_c0_seq1:47-808(+)